ncbi:MAG: prepilin-type N-terminal cleavage/methylation domain-containing protein [bacterium]|nr:prepilin-type N-terminal cleavage/methylation domain-containing protein [bacterium]
MIHREQSGFTLVELIVAIAVTGMVIIGITNLYLMVQSTQRKTYNLELATRAGEKQIESLRNSQYNALVPGENIDFSADLPADLPMPNSGIVTVSEPISGLRRVDIDITYKNGTNDKTVRLSSMIGIIGIAQ